MKVVAIRTMQRWLAWEETWRNLECLHWIMAFPTQRCHWRHEEGGNFDAAEEEGLIIDMSPYVEGRTLLLSVSFFLLMNNKPDFNFHCWEMMLKWADRLQNLSSWLSWRFLCNLGFGWIGLVWMCEHLITLQNQALVNSDADPRAGFQRSTSYYMLNLLALPYCSMTRIYHWGNSMKWHVLIPWVMNLATIKSFMFTLSISLA